jgi:hypothetical protein
MIFFSLILCLFLLKTANTIHAYREGMLNSLLKKHHLKIRCLCNGLLNFVSVQTQIIFKESKQTSYSSSINHCMSVLICHVIINNETCFLILSSTAFWCSVFVILLVNNVVIQGFYIWLVKLLFSALSFTLMNDVYW